MTSDLIRYSYVKDSGVPWLGAVPKHWEVLPLGRMGRLFKGNGASKADEVVDGIPCVRYGDLYTRHEYFISQAKACVAPDRADAYTSINKGDVLFAASGETHEDIGRSAVNLLEGDARCGGDIIVFRPSIAFEPRFLGYAADSPPSRFQKATMGRGFTVVHVYGAQLKHLVLPVPPLPEQAAIVRFLDHADWRIRRYIRAKQKLIKLLEEQKQALIHRAVTRGLDPDVRLKPSGVEWLGDVPEHWEVRRAKALFWEVDERSTNGEEELLSLRMYQGLVPHRDVSSVPISADALVGYKKVLPGQIVMNRMRAAIGMFGIARRPGLVSPDYAVFEPRVHIVTEYFLRLFKTPAAADVFRIESKGLGTGSSGFMRLYTDRFGIIKLPVPPVEEQDQIVNRIAEEIEAIEATTDRLTREVALIREYRARLIADVVTGKLDVREAAARLPDEAEPLDEADVLADIDDERADDAELEEAES